MNRQHYHARRALLLAEIRREEAQRRLDVAPRGKKNQRLVELQASVLDALKCAFPILRERKVSR
jgi:hypothetical protein